jgi:signal transduction histidine kinase
LVARQLADRVRSLPPKVVDSIVALLCGTATATSLIANGASIWMYGLAVVSAAPLVLRRTHPIAVVFACGAATFGLAVTHHVHDLAYGQLVATYTFASLSGPLGRLIGALVTASGVTLSLTMSGKALADFGNIGLVFAAAYVLGIGARARRNRIAVLEERARRLAEERNATAAVERERIARDMHDTLAHAISLMVVQAEAGPVVVRAAPEKAEAAFDAIATTGREALAQLRRTLGVLRSSGGPGRYPQPDLDGLPGLLARARDAGLEATFEEHGDPRPIPGDIATAAYRVVQESLTNTLKHAGAHRVRVELDWRKTALRLEVIDDGRGASRVGDDGHGLIGMRERVSACGGQLSAGNAPSGAGFRVFATLPTGAANG